MARYGILSDIHGNLEALRAAARFLFEEQRVDDIVCLGDLVGYNAEPDACVAVLQDLGVASIAGNHDLIATGALGFERCAVRPAFALRRTREVLSDATLRVLRELPAQMVIEDEAVLFHGGFRDVCQYVRTAGRVVENEALVRKELPRARICFFGHTHERRAWEVHKGVAEEMGDAPEVHVSAADRTYFINPGSVDAARREGERRAELAIFDSDRRVVTFHRVAYDHDASERSAVLNGYRMGPTEERIRAAARTLARRKAGAMWRLSTWWQARSWAPAAGSG